MADPPRQRLLPIIGWVYDDADWLIGIVIELPYDCWVYRPLRVEDRMPPPFPTGKLVDTLRPYLLPNGEGGPEQS